MKKIAVCLMTAIFFVSSNVSAPNRDRKRYWPNASICLAGTITAEGDTIKKVYYSQNGAEELVEEYDRKGHKVLEANLNYNGGLKQNTDG
jgi:hypothetical protein